ncbi:glycosyltransferase family 2 protein [Desulfoprunum benzoelyticum]|uniref:Glycosyltransferase involved in cell wall biosynthesis n=1 Tax=Desulfoprunum benzoelyticum TaxID=1506996 RepID=A0A840UJQ7_9BACT|nr:glycosyltransferase family 2 protein [Desulfoprunum benzoelyticum]MBB5346577.1 glycosyltransferase involved in cell wall biosynthesis [Desulfoprunum benzoelyticum]MBM9528894.1 glycosyltransferase family 2 protein [Desulfoprunum benzoelyticum]
MLVSVVIPLLNEEENIGFLYDELKGVLITLEDDHEIIFIDDGSKDRSLSILQGLQRSDDKVVVVSFRRNFGQTAAMAAGFDYARGDVIITMDADLQNDPHDIPLLLDQIRAGNDVVTGWRFNRKDTFINRRLPSIIANKLISFTTGVNLHDYGCTLKAFRHDVIKNVKLYGEMHRFIPAIASGMGIDFTEVKVNHRPRRFGSSKYGISRTIRVILDLLTVKFLLSYSTRPIQVFGLMGVVSGGIGFLLALIMTLQRQFFGVPLADRPLLFLAIMLIFIGFQFVSLGLIAELQARTYHESQNKAVYYVRSVYRKEPVGGQDPAKGDDAPQ